MSVKSIRLEILKPYNDPDSNSLPVTWKELGTVLHDCQYAVSRMANFVMSQMYLRSQLEYHDKNEQRNIADKKNKMKSYFYPQLKVMYPKIGSALTAVTDNKARAFYKQHSHKIWKLDESLPTFKLNFPIPVRSTAYRLRKVSNNLSL